jgi:hypothetical protein
VFLRSMIGRLQNAERGQSAERGIS